MKITFFLIALIITASPLFAQDNPEGKSQQGRKQVLPREQEARPSFVDEDGDGIDDRQGKEAQAGRDAQSGTSTQGQGRQLRQHRRDHFIDQDGDGINDERCSGTGIRQGHRRGAAKGGVE
jgi:hypothetical protein